MSSGPGPAKASIDYRALAQWAETGAVRPRARPGAQQRRYRLGRWHSRSASSWNPPAATADGPAGARSQSLVSIDISRKPSESRRSSIANGHAPSPPPPPLQTVGQGSTAPYYDVGREAGPLAQMLLQENDEIWNNPGYRFTFYSPATGTVRANDVHTLCTDRADGLDALMRQALDTRPRPAARDAPPVVVDNGDDGDDQPPISGAHSTMPQLSVTSADAVQVSSSPDAASPPPDNVFLHPNYARGQRELRSRPPHDEPANSDNDDAADSARPGGSRLFWLDVMDPTDSEITALSHVFDLHPLTTEELLGLKSQSLAQDIFKSFRHYDVICYRTSSVTAAPPAQDTGPAARPASMETASSRYTAGPAEKDRPFVRDLLWRTRPGHGPPPLQHDAPHKQTLRRRLTSLFSRPPAEGAVDRDGVLSPNAGALQLVADIAGISGDPTGDADDVVDEPIAFYTIVLAEGIVTVHCCNVPHVRNTIARLNMDEEALCLTPDYIAYLLLDDITDTLVPMTRLLELEIDAIDELVLILTRAEHDDVLKRIGIERRHALWLVRLLHGKAEVLRAVERRVEAKTASDSAVDTLGSEGGGGGSASSDSDDEAMASQLLTSDEEEGDLYNPARMGVRSRGRRQPPPTSHPDVTKYLADVHDHLISLTASVHHCERILARAHGNYLARINLELTHASNTTNQLATQMTVLAGIFLPLNLVAGLFGMNVRVPGRDREDLRDFGLIVGSMAVFAIATLVVCRWRRII
ncbi:CorA metal ion transporter [Coemansia spiralis]|nr:CorA metal ion transporter [Coemansia spiralis]